MLLALLILPVLFIDKLIEGPGYAVSLGDAGRLGARVACFHAGKIAVCRDNARRLIFRLSLEPAADFFKQKVNRREPLLTVQN